MPYLDLILSMSGATVQTRRARFDLWRHPPFCCGDEHPELGTRRDVTAISIDKERALHGV